MWLGMEESVQRLLKTTAIQVLKVSSTECSNKVLHRTLYITP
jgi:hypothetical protein